MTGAMPTGAIALEVLISLITALAWSGVKVSASNFSSLFLYSSEHLTPLYCTNGRDSQWIRWRSTLMTMFMFMIVIQSAFWLKLHFVQVSRTCLSTKSIRKRLDLRIGLVVRRLFRRLALQLLKGNLITTRCWSDMYERAISLWNRR